MNGPSKPSVRVKHTYIPGNDDSACASLNLLSIKKIVSTFFHSNVCEYNVLEETSELDLSG
jgi:hypothetical protein